MSEYENAASLYLPTLTKVLFVAEAPPVSVDRYFYFPDVQSQDSLWVQLMRALYGTDFGNTKSERPHKKKWLTRFSGDGYRLIDAVQFPISGSSRERVREIRLLADDLITRVKLINPMQVVLIKSTVFEGLMSALGDAGLPVVNSGPLPFPGSGQQVRFQNEFERLVKSGRLILD